MVTVTVVIDVFLSIVAVIFCFKDSIFCDSFLDNSITPKLVLALLDKTDLSSSKNKDFIPSIIIPGNPII